MNDVEVHLMTAGLLEIPMATPELETQSEDLHSVA